MADRRALEALAVIAEQLGPLLQSLFEADIATDFAIGEESPTATRDAVRTKARGRMVAARLLTKLGAPSSEVGSAREGAPLWPSGWVGSISHRDPVSVVAVAQTLRVTALGIDIERDEPCSAELTRRVCSAAELTRLAEHGADIGTLARVLLSAKETLHKLQFPLSGEPSGLRRFEVLLSEHAFVARLTERLDPLPAGLEVRGRWRRHAGMIWTGASLRPSELSSVVS